MLMYTGASLLCFLTDLCLFSIQYRWYAEAQIDHTNLWMLIVTVVYILFDGLYLIWISSFSRKMPSYINSWILDSVVGDT